MLWYFLLSCGLETGLSNKCAEGLSPIPSAQPLFCVQPFEARILEDGKAISTKGTLPDIHVSFEMATEACANTEVNGRPLRLMNIAEWIMAGGGRRYPWGDSFEENCILDSEKTHGQWKTVQPTGSMPKCVSEYGVFDQIGNAWEWVNLEQTATRDAWLAMIRAKGFEVEVSQTEIQLEANLLPRLQYKTICVYMNGSTIEQGLLVVDLASPIPSDCVDAGQGYLWFRQHEYSEDTIPEPGSLLPVKLWGSRIVWHKERDGERVGAKVGGSYYSGGASTLNSFWVGHIPSFDGSIGFRCAQSVD